MKLTHVVIMFGMLIMLDAAVTLLVARSDSGYKRAVLSQ